MELSESKKRPSQLARWRAEGEAMVAAWQASGLSMRAYAQQAGINERRLSLWRRRLATSEEISAASHFVPVSVGEHRGLADGNGLEVLIDQRVRIQVTSSTDLGLLRQTVSALQC